MQRNRCVTAPAVEGLYLIGHESNERRDHDRDILQQRGRQLVGERLAASSGEHSESVAPVQHSFDQFSLARDGKLP